MNALSVYVRIGRFKAFSRFAAGYVVVVSSLVLVGWSLQMPVLKSLVPGLRAMNPVSAATCALAGVALFLMTAGAGGKGRRLRAILSVIVILVGLLRVGGVLFHWTWEIDSILFDGELKGNQMPPGTAVGFVMVGLALLFGEVETQGKVCPSEIMVYPPMMIALLALLGYGYQIQALYSMSSFAPMSLHAAITIEMLCLGILFAKPDRCMMRLVSSDSDGGRMARQMLPASVAVLCVVGWLRLQGERIGLYGSELGLALFMVVNITILGWLILRNARQLARADAEREEAARALREAHAELERRVIERTGALAQVVTELSNGITMILEVARDITDTSDLLSTEAGESASATAETTATVEEVRQTARVNARDAGLVAASAQDAARISKDGRKSTEDTIAAIEHVRGEMGAIGNSMMRLNDQTQAIGQIMSAVNAIASQSNILAVNAAIEAAKAGERGKGFAVVAREVRTLADQSRRATRQVGTILNDIQRATHLAIMTIDHGRQAVEHGVGQSVQAGASIEALAANVTAAADAATHIAGTSQQQMLVIDQVATAMGSIRQGAIHTVTSARKLELAAQNLKELSQKLQLLVVQYKTQG
jgi:methyl-accepting chemotaxis protein